VIYWDSSALIKKYLKEVGTESVRRWLSEDSLIVTSQLSYAEIQATFARKSREKTLPPKDYRSIRRSFDADWKAMFIVYIDDVLLPIIRRLVESHPLRGADSVQLASALYVSERIRPEPLQFACADTHLLHAAIAEGMNGLNPLEMD